MRGRHAAVMIQMSQQTRAAPHYLETGLPDFDGYALVRLSRVCPRLNQTTLVLFAARAPHSYDLIGSLSLPTATA